ncbi:T9SS type A sorting domain-containing protein [Hymenobacter sp. 15J16-1T3B]|uniref:T9SS type A sorting domain-containing protein n=1 Tax=Hymenobacter sp. 15J16-1T3B TaxID=2886941 RepID=UPI001D122D5E|nr:T9SS type A sorting domain-containing protein [Hymenobacter sp. 15J16-1T3B]MCC3159299.1 T9SS type A sorting domain-containing protein [Hymenobacter sp. 15J16-1T3B]
MKYISTLFATGALALLGLNAQAQAPITINGQLAASEVATNGYQLVGRFTNPHGFGDAGLLALYAASDANNLYFFIAGTLENNTGGVSNSLQLFIDRPGSTPGVPVGTILPAGGANTSFANTTIKLDLAADMAIGIKGTGTGNQVQVDGVVYTSSTAATGGVLTGTTPLNTTGTAGTITAANAPGNLAPFVGSQVAYTSSANLSSNPGFSTTTPGNAPSNGLEIAVSRSAIGLPTAGGTVQIFALQNNSGGGYLSSDFIPQNNAAIPTTLGYPLPNLGGPSNGTPNAVDFANIPGTQAASLNVTATNLTVTSNRAKAEAVALNVYPNPVQGEATVTYRVQNAQQQVNIELTDLMGRRVSTVFAGQQGVGVQSQKLGAGNVAAGTYLVKVQVGEQVATHKVTLL